MFPLFSLPILNLKSPINPGIFETHDLAKPTLVNEYLNETEKMPTISKTKFISHKNKFHSEVLTAQLREKSI